MKKLTNTSEQILSSARALIIAGGYNGFSYADIANVVGIRKASIHHHFPNKVDLVKAIVTQHRQATAAGIVQLGQAIPDPFAQLNAYVQYWEACITDLSSPFCVCALLAGELPILPAEVATEVRGHFMFLARWIASVLERGAGAGTIHLTRAPGIEADVFMATVHGAMLSARAYGDNTVFGVITRTQLERFAAPTHH